MNTALSFYGVVQQEERLFTVLAAAAVSGFSEWREGLEFIGAREHGISVRQGGSGGKGMMP